MIHSNVQHGVSDSSALLHHFSHGRGRGAIRVHQPLEAQEVFLFLLLPWCQCIESSRALPFLSLPSYLVVHFAALGRFLPLLKDSPRSLSAQIEGARGESRYSHWPSVVAPGGPHEAVARLPDLLLPQLSLRLRICIQRLPAVGVTGRVGVTPVELDVHAEVRLAGVQHVAGDAGRMVGERIRLRPQRVGRPRPRRHLEQGMRLSCSPGLEGAEGKRISSRSLADAIAVAEVVDDDGDLVRSRPSVSPEHCLQR
eukprot:524378-Hanusia_phi.AAC.3